MVHHICMLPWRAAFLALILGTLPGVDAPPASDPAGPGSWQLPAGAFLPAKMPMAVTFPRPEASSWAYAKQAHPGIRWEIPIVIQGGAWPFRYDLVDHGGAEGLRIGSTLRRTQEGGHILHHVTEDYGVLSWDDPRPGTYGIQVRVTDQEGSAVLVEVPLTVGAEGWLFIDAERGDDANDGSQGAPFRTMAPLVANADGFAQHRVYLSGVVRMLGNRDNGNLRIQGGHMPVSWIGLPGGKGIFELPDKRINLAAPDFYLANLEFRHAEEIHQDNQDYIHMITVWENSDRFTFHDVVVSRFHGVPKNTDLGNSSVVMFTKSGERRNHVAIVNCTLTGPSGIFTSTYTLHDSVIEKNRAINADFRLADGSVWAVIYIKGGNNERISIRANEFWEDNTWTKVSGAIGILQARNIEVCYNTVSTSHTKGRKGTLILWTDSPQASYHWLPETKVWIYRNSLRGAPYWGGERLAHMPDGTVISEANAVDGSAWPDRPRIVRRDNREGQAGEVLDAGMRLTGALRGEALGSVGAEIAAP